MMGFKTLHAQKCRIFKMKITQKFALKCILALNL